jgi:hypothetical protein
MWDDIDPTLLPSQALQEELRKIALEMPGFPDLCRQLPDEKAPEDPNLYIYAERGSEKLV